MPTKPYALLTSALRLEEDQGCLMVGGHPVLWPRDATWDATRQSVEMERDGSRVTISVDNHFPPQGLGGGLIPLVFMTQYLDNETAQRAKNCLKPTDDSVLVVN